MATKRTTFSESNISIANNTSNLTINVYFSAQNSTTWFQSATLSCSCNGSTQSKTVSHSKGGSVSASFTFSNIKHNDDGKKSVSWSWSCKTGTSGLGTQSDSGTHEMQQIPRTSEPTLSTSEANLGDTIKINTNRKSTSFTHRITYSIGSIKDSSLSNNVGDSFDWIIPKDIANQITTSDNGIIVLKVTTMSGSETIGSKELNLKVKVPTTDEFQPTISDVVLTEVGNVPSSLGFFVQNNSRIKGVVKATGVYGSTISSYSININNESFVSAEFTTSLVSLVNPKLKVTIKDSRGRSKVYEKTITVLEYQEPTITNFSTFRNAKDQTKIDISFKCSIYKLNGKNTNNFKFYYKKNTEQSYSSMEISNIKESTSGNVIVYSANYSIITTDVNTSYDTYMTATDIFNKEINSEALFINTAFKLLNISADKKNFSIGKLHEKAGYNEMALPEIHYDNIYRENGDYNGLVLSCPSIKDGEIRFNDTNKSLEMVINGITYEIKLVVKS